MNPLSPDELAAAAATPRHPLDPSGRALRLLDSGVQMELGDPSENELTYLERTLCQVSLPYRNPGAAVSHWVRRNGNLQLTVRPGIGADGNPVWAYGVMPRLLLKWISDQVIKKTSAVDGRTVVFNDSLRGFLEDLGIGYTGPNGRKVRQQVFKAKFIPQLTAVQVAWPMFRFDAQEKTLLLWATDTYKRHLAR